MVFDSQGPVDVDKRLAWTIKRPLFLAAQLFLGAIFIFASLDKILNPLTFAKSIDNYQILPDRLVSLSAIILPSIELILGSLLVAEIWLPGAIALVNLLLVTFFTALVFNVARGLNVDCGCFTQSKVENPSTSWYFGRDSFFLLMSGYLFYRMFVKPSQPPDDPRKPGQTNRI